MNKIVSQFYRQLNLPEGNKISFRRKYQPVGDYFPHGIAYVNSLGEKMFISYPDLEIKARQYVSSMQKAGDQPKDLVIIEIDDTKKFFYAQWDTPPAA